MNWVEDMKREVKAMSIASFLRQHGLTEKKMGKRSFFLSPISGESNPSLLVNADNTFYDFSSNVGGDIISLVRHMWGTDFIGALNLLSGKEIAPYSPPERKKVERLPRSFSIERYLCDDPTCNMLTKHYLNGRRIKRWYQYGHFYAGSMVGGALFPHYDTSGKLVGCKIRNSSTIGRKWHFDGSREGAYVIDCSRPYAFSTTLYISESETSSNSLAEVLMEYGKSGVVVSFGAWTGISSNVEKWESYFSNFDQRKIVIDYDGSEEKFRERIKLYEAVEGDYVKMLLPKGEDVNSLYAKGKGHVIRSFI